MQSKWKKVGAVLGSAVMIGATLAGAALAQDTAMDLGDYETLMVSNGALNGLFVVGATAATADVVSAIDMAAFAANSFSGTGSSSGSGEVTLTPISTQTAGVKRHVEFEQNAGSAYEFGSGTAVTDVVGPAGYASGDGVVDFLYSHNEKGFTYFSSTEGKWHEEVRLTLASVTPVRDTKDTNRGDQYDEVFLQVNANALEYRYNFDTVITPANLTAKKIWFMGKESTVISSTVGSEIKLGSTDSEVILTTSDPSTTVSGVDVTLGGIFSVGTSNTFEAKVTVTNGGTTESKFIASGDTDTIAGIEIYVQNAVVTTSGTNEGEAKLIVGAGITKLEDGGFLKFGDGTETSWLVDLVADSTATGSHGRIDVKDTEPHTTVSSSNTVLYAGDSIDSPNGLFSLTYNGLTDKYGGALQLVDIDLTPTTGLTGGTHPIIRVRTPGGDFLQYYDSSNTSKLTNQIYINTTEQGATTANRMYYRDTTQATLTYTKIGKLPVAVQLTQANTLPIYYTNVSETAAGYLNITEPALDAGTRSEITIEYNASANSGVGQFEDSNVDSNDFYAFYAAYSTNGSVDNFFGDSTATANPATRDFYTLWGIYVDSVGSTLISLQAPIEQAMGELVVGTQSEGKGTPVTVSAGETATIGGTTVEVAGSISGTVPATLPSTLAKVDTAVTSADKSGKTLVLVGGPAVNTLVTELKTTGSLTTDVAGLGKGKGVVELVADAFVDGQYAIVVAGSDRAGTAAASNVLANYNAATLDGKTVHTV